MKRLFLFLSFVLILSGLSLAEYSGNITLTTIVTGVYGSSLSGLCNSTGEHCAAGDVCRFAYDNNWQGSKGNCTSFTTKCLEDTQQSNGYWRDSGYKFCDGSVLAECSSGTWISTVCSGGCANETCLTTTTAATTAPATTSTISDYAVASIEISIYPNDFDIIQGQSSIKTVEVTNNGELSLSDIVLSLSGMDSSWITITPAKYTSLSIGAKTTYTIKFLIPENATVKTYGTTIEVTTSNTSVSAAKNINVRILPSNETVSEEIIPKYQDYMGLLDSIEGNITELEESGINTTDIRAIFEQIKAKLSEANASIESMDYFAANELLGDVQTLIDDLNVKIYQAKYPGIDIFLIIIIAVVVIVAVVIAYLFWPVESSFKFKQPSNGNAVNKLLEKIKNVRKKEKKPFAYKFKQ